MHTTVAAALKEIRDANTSAWGARTWVTDLLMQAIELQQRQIEDLRADLRREVAAMNRAINQASPDYGEP